MIPKLQRKITRWMPGILIFAAPALLVQAQTNTADDDSNIVELSPFEVDASQDVGYQASSTLAGTRVATDLRDIGASVSIITQEFLEDTGSADAEDLLVYTANTEVGGTGGNYSAAVKDGTGFSFDTQGQRFEPQRATRVRGLSEADITQGFFLTDVPFDSYNVDRIAINRGPNSALFGLGSPGGILNASLKNALFDDRTEMNFTVGRFGTHRETLDVNRELIEGKLAVRVNALFEKEKFQQDPTFERDERVHGEILYRPWPGTTLRINGGVGSINANRPRTLPPTDAFTYWWDGGKPTHLGEQHVLDDGSGSGKGNLHNEYLVSAFEMFFQATTLYDDHTSSEPASDPGDAIVLWQRNAHTQSVNIFFGKLAVAPLRWQASAAFGNDGRFDARTGVEGSASFFTNESIADRGIFDYREQLLDGPNKFENQSFDTLNVTLAQRLFDDRFGVELAFDKQNYERLGSTNGNGERGQLISIDVATTLYDGTPNPHFGRPYHSYAEGTSSRITEREAFRATTFLKLKASDLFGGDMSDYLFGRHNFTGFFNRQSIEETTGSFGPFNTLEYFDRMVDSDGNHIYPLNARGGVFVRGGIYSYLGPSVFNLADPTDANIPNIQARQPAREARNGFLWVPETESWERGQTVGQHHLPVSHQVQLDEVDSTVFVWQGFFANDKLVPAFSWRKDKLENFQANAPTGPNNQIFPDQTELPSTPGITAETQVRSWSLVAHTPEFINEMLPFDTDLSVHYISAENFQISGRALNLLGEVLPFPTGQTDEYGFTVNTFGGKLVARINFFETKQANQRIGVPGGGLLVSTYNNVLRENPPEDIAAAGLIAPWEDPAMAEFHGIADAYVPELVGNHVNGNPDYSFSSPGAINSTRNIVTEGMEIEISANPTPNWRLAFNISQQEAQQSDSAPLAARYIAARRSVWFTGPTSELIAEPTGGTFADLATRRFINPLLQAQAQDGGAVQEMREWRWNLVTNYKFADAEGWLGGLGVGGAIRWQDDIAIGFPIHLVDGVALPDVDNAYFGETETSVDLWFTYEGTAWSDKVDWKLRLGIRNLTSDEGLIPLTVQPDGAPAFSRIEPPRTFELSLKLNL